jgi:hypothetical protein
VLIADLSHYDGADPERHPAAWRQAEQLRDIVRCATTVPAALRLDSALRCSRRPGRRPCPGHLVMVRMEVPAEIHWRCSSCGDDGVITGWQGSHSDLGPARPLGELALLVELADDEHRLLREIQVLDTDRTRVVYGAFREADGRLFLFGDDQDVEELAGFVAFEANHEDRLARRARLDAVYAKLSHALGGRSASPSSSVRLTSPSSSERRRHHPLASLTEADLHYIMPIKFLGSKSPGFVNRFRSAPLDPRRP